MKEVNFSSNNFIKSYQYYAFPLGVLAYDDYNYNKWMLGKFINIYCDEVLQFDELSYDDWDIINDQLYKNLNIDTFKSIIINSIDNNQAVHLWEINEKYIPNTNAYKKYDCAHDLLVLGYDEYNNLLIINYNKNRQLLPQIIPFDCLQNSFTQYTEGRSFNFIKENIQITSCDNIIDKINHYINPIRKNELKYYNNERNFYNHSVVGISALEKFSEKLKLDFNNIDYLNSLCLLDEHVLSMLNNLLYLCNKKIISSSIAKDYANISKLSNLSKLQFLKNLSKQSTQLEYDILINIQRIIHQESLILNRIFK
ncbi:MAG: hypothetical protein RR448_03525 [Niameybacter sp.]